MQSRLKHLVFALGLSALIVTGCNDNKTNNNNNNNNGTNTDPTVVTQSPAFTASDATTGVSFSVPAGAYDATAAQPKFTVAKSTTLPAGATLPTGATQGPVYTITKDYADTFLQPVSITVPYDPAVNALPVVFHWDAANNKYQAASIQNIDPTAKTVTYSSVAFSSFPLLSSAAGAGTAADSGFVPLTDGFKIANFGTFAAPGQSSLAMSAIASWYYTNQKAAAGKGLYDLWKTDDTTAKIVVSAAQQAATQLWSKEWKLSNYKLDADQTGMLLISALQLTGQPQLLIMKSVVAGTDTSAVAVLVYKYVPNNGTPPGGRFSIYNPDFPGEETTLDWTSGKTTGSFSNYSKAGAYANPFTNFAFYGFPSIASSGQYKTMYDNITKAAAQSTITLTSPTLDATGTYTQTLTGSTLPDVAVAGTVAGSPSSITFNLNGGPLQTIALANGAFNFTLKGTDLKSENNVTFTNATIRNPYAFTGFKSFYIKFVGTSVSTFQNFGFETGDKTGWTTETHEWQTNTDQVPAAGAADTVQRNFVGCPFTKATSSGTGFDSCTYDATAAAIPACTATSKVGDLCYNEFWGTVIKFTPATFTPEKSAIVGKTTVFDKTTVSNWYSGLPATFTPGIDPVIDTYQQGGGDKTILGQALNLPVYFNGSWALRVNNADNNNHASTASQSATIPNVAAPEIRFAWAAVLEDPGHENSAQPFVDVSVIDETTAVVLYRKFFYSGNPEYSGWVKLETHTPTSTRWNVIPWQKVTITGAALANAVGHRVTIRVYASDCIYSGHGGYAYLDDAP